MDSSPDTSPRRTARIRSAEWLFAGGITLLVIALHLVLLFQAGALWRDEVNTVSVATRPSMSELWAALSHESFPILIFGVVRLWEGIGLGQSDFGLRVLGALIGMSLLWVLWAGRASFGRHVPLLSLGLLALNPVMVRWGDSVRAYGLGAVCIVAAFAAIWRVTESATPRRIALAALAAIASVQCLYQNSFLLLAMCLGGVAVCARNGTWRTAGWLLGIGAVAAASLLPYAGTIEAGRAVLEIGRAERPLSRFLDLSVRAAGFENVAMSWIWIVLAIACAGAALGWQLARARAGDPDRRRDIALFCGTTMVAGTAGFLVFLKLAGLATHRWYYLGLIALHAVCIEGILGALAVTDRRRIARLVLLLGIVGLTLLPAWRAVQARQTNLDLIAAKLTRETVAGDLVVISPWYCGIAFGRYYRGPGAWTTVPPMADVSIHRNDLLRAAMAAAHPLEPLMERMTRTLQAGRRVWWVGGFGFVAEGQEPPSLPPAPHGPSGWMSAPYEEAWAVQVGHFLQTRAARGAAVSIPIEQAISPFENLQVVTAEGWR
jgi:hypothetical protein